MGKPLDELKGPKFPDCLEHIWSAFLELNETRLINQVANPITYGEIKDFMETTYTVLSPRDIKVITKLDKEYRDVMNSTKD